MSTKIFTVPALQSLIFPVPNLTSVCVQPTAGGSVTLGWGQDGVNPQFTNVIQSGNTSPFSFAAGTYAVSPNNLPAMGNIGKIQVTAAGAAAPCTVIISDLSEYPGSFPERLTVGASNVAYTMPSSTSELELFSIRFPAGTFQMNWRINVYFQLTVTNNANVKTLNQYFGPSLNSATAGALEVAAAGKFWSNVYTSMAGAEGFTSFGGRNDGQTVICANPGLLSTGGWGSSTTANTTISNTNYNAGASTVEQCYMMTGTKATAGDAFTLDSILVELRQ